MIFFLGLILGILVSFILFLGYVYLQLKGVNRVHRTIQMVEDKAKPQAKIFPALSDEEEAQELIVQRNEKEGKETRAEELGI